MTQYINYKGEKYPYKEVGNGVGIVSTVALEEALMQGLAQDDERAEDIDDHIRYYLSPEEWKLSDKEIAKLMERI